MTNGGGLGILAVDVLASKVGRLAELDAPLMVKLNHSLPSNWSHNNPIDMIGDADPKRYASVLTHLMDSECVDVILIMYAPSALSDSEATAQAIIDVLKQHPKRKKVNVLTNWTGENAAKPARQLFSNAKIATFRTPKGAITAFMHLVQHRRNKKLLIEMPCSVPEHLIYDTNAAAYHIQNSLQATPHSVTLGAFDSKPLLDAYHLNTIDTYIAVNIEDAIAKANIIGYPLAVKINSPDIEYKSQVHGVMLNINNAGELDTAIRSISKRVKIALPDARLTGFILQKMMPSGLALELRVMIKQDAIFGPVIAISQDSDARDLNTTLDNAVVALPPLNMALARYLVIQAIKDKKIKIKQHAAEFNMQAICLMLTQISQMLLDNPDIEDVDLNPVLVSANEVSIVDCQVHLVSHPQSSLGRFAISPYPKQLEELQQLNNGQRIIIRPIRAEDEAMHHIFDHALTPEDRYKRYLSQRGEINHEEMVVLTQIDYEREMAFIAVRLHQATNKKHLR